jgi:hypothetical protein
MFLQASWQFLHCNSAAFSINYYLYILDNRKCTSSCVAPCLLCTLGVARFTCFTGLNLHDGVLWRLRWQSGQAPRSGLVALVLSQGCNASTKHLCIPEEVTSNTIWRNVEEICEKHGLSCLTNCTVLEIQDRKSQKLVTSGIWCGNLSFSFIILMTHLEISHKIHRHSNNRR